MYSVYIDGKKYSTPHSSKDHGYQSLYKDQIIRSTSTTFSQWSWSQKLELYSKTSSRSNR